MSWRDPIIVALLTLVSVGALKWSFKTIAEQLIDRKRVKAATCPSCGGFVQFPPPLKLPSARELARVGMAVGHAMVMAEAGVVPGTFDYQVTDRATTTPLERRCRKESWCVQDEDHEGACAALGCQKKHWCVLQDGHEGECSIPPKEQLP